ncbi:MAG: hypothetical protein ACO24H_05130 [Polynucleobacter sp.]
MKLSDLVAKYIEARDRKARLKADYDMAVDRLEKVMEKIEVKLLEVFDQTGMDSVKTEFGTAYTSTRSSASVADREAFMEFVRKKDEWALLEVRASKTAVEQYKDAHSDLPPGINWREERVVNIRRSA